MTAPRVASPAAQERAAPSLPADGPDDARLWATDEINVDAALTYCTQQQRHPPSVAARRDLNRRRARVAALRRPGRGGSGSDDDDDNFDPKPVQRVSGRAARKRADDEAAAAASERPVKRRRPKTARSSALPPSLDGGGGGGGGVDNEDDFSDLLAAVRAVQADGPTPPRRAATGQAIAPSARQTHAGVVTSDHEQRSAVLEEAFRLLLDNGNVPARQTSDAAGGEDADDDREDARRLGALQEEACRMILEDFVQTLAVSDYYHGDNDGTPRLDVAAARRNLVQLALHSGASVAEGDDARRRLAHELYDQFRAAVRKTAAVRGMALAGDRDGDDAMDSADEGNVSNSSCSNGSPDDDIDDLLSADELDHGDTVALEGALRARHANGHHDEMDSLLDSDDDVDDEYAMPSMRGVGPAGMSYMQNQMRSILSVAYERVLRERGNGVEARCLGEVPIIGPQHVRRYLREPDYTCGERVCSNAGRAFNTVSGEYQHRPDENRCMAFWDFGFALREFRTPDEEAAAAASATTTTTTTTDAADAAGPCIYCIRATVNYMFWSYKCNNAQQADVVIQPHGYMTGVPGAYSTAWMLPQVGAFHGLSAAFIRHVRSNYFESPDGVRARNDSSRVLRTLVEDRRVFFEQ